MRYEEAMRCDLDCYPTFFAFRLARLRLPSYIPRLFRLTTQVSHVSRLTSHLRPAASCAPRLLFADKVAAGDAMPPAKLDLGLAFGAAGKGLVLAAVGTEVNRSAGGETPAAETASKPRFGSWRWIRIRFSRHTWRSGDDGNRVRGHTGGAQGLEGDHVGAALGLPRCLRFWRVEVDILRRCERFIGTRAQRTSEPLGFQL